MNTYVKRNEAVTAIQFTVENAAEVVAFINDGVSRLEPSGKISVKTFYGFVAADVNDWIIKDRAGRVSVESREAFETLYQEAP